MVDFQLDIYNKLHPEGNEPKGFFFLISEIIKYETFFSLL
jgi:hypothetical protein